MKLEDKINYVTRNVLRQTKNEGFFVSFNEQSNLLFDKLIAEAFDIRRKPRLLKDARFVKRMTSVIIDELNDTGEFLEGLIEAIETAKKFYDDEAEIIKESERQALKYDYLTYYRLSDKMMLQLNGKATKGLGKMIQKYRRRVKSFKDKVELMPHESELTYKRLIAYDILAEQKDINNIARLLL